MQPLQVNLNSSVTDSCSSCSCCFPIKKKKKKDKVDEASKNYFMEKKIDENYEKSVKEHEKALNVSREYKEKTNSQVSEMTRSF